MWAWGASPPLGRREGVGLGTPRVPLTRTAAAARAGRDRARRRAGWCPGERAEHAGRERAAAFTPNVNNGVVLTMVQVEPRIIVGCSFTSVSPPGASRGAQAMFRNYLLPFDATTGQVDPVILPALDGVGPPTYAGAR